MSLRPPVLALFVALALAASAPAGTAAAAAPPPQLAVTVQELSGRPVSYLTVAGEPGSPVTAGTLSITNAGKRRLAVDVDPVSAVTASNLGSAYALTNEPLRGAATWLDLSTRSVVLMPGARTTVRVGVDVPAGEPDGEYLAGVAIEARGQAAPAARGEGVAISSAQRYVVGVQANVGSASKPRLSFTGAAVEREPAGVTFLLAMANPGDVILKNVHGRVRVERGDRTIAKAPIGPGTFVTGTSIELPVLARRENPPEGTRYVVHAVAHYPGGTARLDETVTFGQQAAVRQEQFGGRPVGGGFPWLLAAAIAAALVLLASLAAVALRRRRRRSLPAAAGTLAIIEQALASPGALPLTLIGVDPDTAEPASRLHLEAALRGRLRPSDVLTEPAPGTLVVVAPMTSEQGAAALADDAQLLATRAGVAARVMTVSAPAPVPAVELLGSLLAELSPAQR